MQIRICGIPHEITECTDGLSVDTHFGLIDYAKAEIRINKDMSQGMKEETLCHEVLHGMLVLIGRDDLSADETFVQALGNAIHQSFTPRIEH